LPLLWQNNMNISPFLRWRVESLWNTEDSPQRQGTFSRSAVLLPRSANRLILRDSNSQKHIHTDNFTNVQPKECISNTTAKNDLDPGQHNCVLCTFSLHYPKNTPNCQNGFTAGTETVNSFLRLRYQNPGTLFIHNYVVTYP
jgi:hypothetical protein